MSEPARSAETEAYYTHRFIRLWARAASEQPALNWPEFLGWMGARKSGWSYSSWRQYHAAVAFVLAQRAAQEPDLVPLIDHWKALSGKGGSLAKGQGKTSAQRAILLPRADLNKLVYALRESRSRYATATRNWLLAGYWTGVRPAEWASAVLSETDGGVVLRVKNAKYSTTQSRAPGTHRAIVLTHLPPDVYQIVSEHVALCAEIAGGDGIDEEAFSLFYRECRKLMYKVARTVFPRRTSQPTLYSARHQFIANAKAAGASPETIAAVSGHRSPETASLHYAKRRSGYGPDFKVAPVPGQLALVRPAKPSNLPGPGQSWGARAGA